MKKEKQAETWIVLNPTRSISISDFFFGGLLVAPTRILLFISRRSIALYRIGHIFTIQSGQRYKYIYWNYKWKHAYFSWTQIFLMVMTTIAQRLQQQRRTLNTNESIRILLYEHTHTRTPSHITFIHRHRDANKYNESKMKEMEVNTKTTHTPNCWVILFWFVESIRTFQF